MEKKEFFYSDDYAGLQTTAFNFYYGYEETISPIDRNEDNWNKQDFWCFVAYNNKNGAEMCRFSTIQIEKAKFFNKPLENPRDYLLVGIGMFLNSFVFAQREPPSTSLTSKPLKDKKLSK
jgi:hypothetical protein